MATTYDLNAILKQAGVGSNFVNQTNAGKNTQSIDQIMQLITRLPEDSEERAGVLDSTFGLPTDAFSTALANKVRSGADLGDLRKQLTDYYGADGITQMAFVDPKSLDARRLYIGSNGKLLATSKYNEGQNWAQKAISIGVPIGLAAITGNVGAAAAGGAATVAGAAAGGATAGGVQAATTGGDIGKGILLGGALGGLGAGIKNIVSPGLTEALGPTGGKIATGAVQGAGKALLTGGDVGKALLTGGLNAGIKTGLGSLFPQQGLSNSLVPGNGDHGFIDQRTDPLVGGNGGTNMDWSSWGLDDGGEYAGSDDWGNAFNYDGSFVDQEADLPQNSGTLNPGWYDALGGGSGLSGLGGTLGGALSSAGGGLLSALQKNPQLFGTLGATGLAALVAGKPGPVDPRISPAIDQLKAISSQQLNMANDSYARQKALLTEFSPLLRQQLQQSIDARGKANQRADSIWSDYATNFQPVQAKLAKDALGYDTAQRRTAAQQEAEGLVASNFQTQREQMAQAQMGQQVGSDASAANDAALRIAEAKARAGAGTAARTGIESRGLQLVDNAARVGMQLPGLSTQQSALGLNQGQAVQSGVRGLGELSAAPEAVAAPLYGNALTGANAVGQLGIGLTGAQNGQYTAKAGLVGDLLGAGLRAYNYYGDQPKKP